MPHSPSGIKNTNYRQYQKDNQPNIFHYYYIAKTASRLYLIFYVYLCKYKNTILFGNSHVYLKENLVFAYILTFLHKKCKKLWYYQFILIYLHRFNRVLK